MAMRMNRLILFVLCVVLCGCTQEINLYEPLKERYNVEDLVNDMRVYYPE
ncbi:hypothetical protein LCGC14_0434790 [marine sediment metagenome]|uniref:Uncharacterized protein n=1 Tax=marine sediment metagenome TaxID=412755 RepID=A0A0F9T540_9ZZZZ